MSGVVAPHLCVAGCMGAAMWFAGPWLVSHVVARAVAGGWGQVWAQAGGLWAHSLTCLLSPQH